MTEAPQPGGGDVRSARHEIQLIVDALAPEVKGRDVDVVRAVLADALRDAGIGRQPEGWMLGTAVELSKGRQVLMDADEARTHEKERQEHEESQDGVPDSAVDQVPGHGADR